MKIFGVIFTLAFLFVSTKSHASRLRRMEVKHLEKLIHKYYSDENINFNMLWDDPTANGMAKPPKGKTKKQVFIYGGFLNSEKLSKNSLALIMCHEVGHHLGGEPYGVITKRGNGNDNRGDFSELSNEGQADYWASSECAWNVLKHFKFHGIYHTSCLDKFSREKDQAVCSAIISAGLEYLQFTQELKDEDTDLHDHSTELDHATRHLNKGEYPSTACRMNTYIAGALRSDQRPSCWWVP